MPPEIKHTIRQLEKKELDAAVEVFAQAIPRDWPNTSEEARSWVFDEFHHSDAVLLGYVSDEKIEAVICLLPLTEVLLKVGEKEKRLLMEGLKICCPGVTVDQMIHVGGLAKTATAPKQGLAQLLYVSAHALAQRSGYKVCIGHTARRSEKYPSMMILDTVAKQSGLSEVPTSEKIYYTNPPDLEKVWVHRLC